MPCPGVLAYLRDMGGKATHHTTEEPTMTKPVYRVSGVYASGRYVSHLIEATDALRAIQHLQAVDNRIIRVTEARVAFPAEE